MKIHIESTSKVVRLLIDGGEVPARIWQGETDSGTPVQVFVTRIAPEVSRDDSLRLAEFERELQMVATPRPTIEAIPLRLIL